MSASLDKSKGPGIYIPPPLFYVLTFIIALQIQKKVPISDMLFHTTIMKLLGVIFILGSLFFLIRSLRQFFITKNTVVLIKPASSLQTTGVYAITRNPMYLGLGILYVGITGLIGNWWNLILFPFLMLIIQEYIIKREERYLEAAFGQEYIQYKSKTRRWL
ncbi:MAG: isoprenylcysteine carboxylmethyltransferase family protein [Bacteroidetes bacterium]|nr:isoprenylcysteine carboxylmethyltransferase family protein [Bacteroidota bacterium]